MQKNLISKGKYKDKKSTMHEVTRKFKKQRY